jgi:4-hydroxy-2-oxoheptanedioate aldolase
VGTFLKLPSIDGVDLARHAGFDLVAIDAEHSSLSGAAVIALIRHATAIGIPAMVRVPAVDPAQINIILEAGAAGIQLSTVRRRAEVDALVSATRYAPAGERSISLAHPSAAFGAAGLAGYLSAEAACPPILVAQIETATTVDPLPTLLPGVDVTFIGTTDLTVSLAALERPPAASEAPPAHAAPAALAAPAAVGVDGSPRLAARVAEIAEAARTTGTVLGGWLPTADAAQLTRYGLDSAGYLLVGSDLQMLASGLRATAAAARQLPL